MDATDLSRRRGRGLELAREGNGAGLDELRIGVLSTHNLDLLSPFLVEALERAGLFGDVYLGPFGQLEREVLDASSGLYARRPSAVVLVPAVEDLLGALYERAATAPDGLADERLQEWHGLVAAALERAPEATVYVVVSGPLRLPGEHVLDPASAQRGQAEVDRLLAGLRALAGPRVVVVDFESRVRALGLDRLHDPRLWYLARMRLGQDGVAALADALAEHVAAAQGRPRKVVALDADDLLWGGVVGEAGVGGLELGGDGLGLAFADLQRVLRGLRDSGVLLAICSKNERADVDDVLAAHPGMVLGREDFAGIRAGWEDKATSLRALADELELGLDSFVFLDDNPFEREWVREALPEVLVPEVPSDPVERPGWLARAPFFQRVTVTDADAARTESYRAQGARKELRSGVSSYDDFLAALEQEVSVEPLTAAGLARAVQLSQRTNQFNLTLARYDAAAMETLLADPSREAHTLGLRDRFGDSGVTGLAVLRVGEGEAEIEALLLSCRVLGRRVEDAFLAVLADRAVARGARTLVGRFVPGPRNAQAARFYADRGFEEGADGSFRLDLERARPEPPAGVAFSVAANA